MPSYMTPAEAAVVARCNVNFVYAALQTGELAAHQAKKPKGRWLIEPVDLHKWLRNEYPGGRPNE